MRYGGDDGWMDWMDDAVSFGEATSQVFPLKLLNLSYSRFKMQVGGITGGDGIT